MGEHADGDTYTIQNEKASPQTPLEATPSCLAQTVLQTPHAYYIMKGREPEWANPQ